MKQKTYKIFRMFFVMILAGICSASVVRGNYVLPIVVAVTAAIVMFGVKKRVEGVLADERDYKNAGDAARWALTVYAMGAALAGMTLMATRTNNLLFEPIAQVLVYSACGLMVVQSLLFKYFQSRK